MPGSNGSSQTVVIRKWRRAIDVFTPQHVVCRINAAVVIEVAGSRWRQWRNQGKNLFTGEGVIIHVHLVDQSRPGTKRAVAAIPDLKSRAIQSVQHRELWNHVLL